MASCSSSHGIAHFYLHHVLSLLERGQHDHAAALLKHAACYLMAPDDCPRSTAWTVGLGLEVGNVRRVNEDYVFWAVFDRAQPDGTTVPIGLFVVADGMGGHACGHVAAREAIHTCVDYVLSIVLTQHQADARSLLQEGVKRANNVVHHKNLLKGLQPGSTDAMGTTMTAALCVGAQAVVANVGDSRTYLFHDGGLKQVTRDHSYVADAVASGVLSSDQLYTHPHRHLINRALGAKEEVVVDLFSCQLTPGSRLLLCSDGLWEMVPDRGQITAILTADLVPEVMAERLVQLALAEGGWDNIGVIVAHYQPRADNEGPTTVLPELSSPTLCGSCEPGR